MTRNQILDLARRDNMTVEMFTSPNRSANRQGYTGVVDTVVLHTTGGTTSSGHNTIMNASSQVSYWAIINNNTGVIRIYGDLTDMMWANGTDNSGGNRDNSRSRLGYVRTRRQNANWYTVAISFGDMLSSNPTDIALRSANWLINTVIQPWARQRANPGIRYIVGHDMITPVTRPNCPGQRFPWNRINLGGVPAVNTDRDLSTVSPVNPTQPTNQTPTPVPQSTVLTQTVNVTTYTVVRGDTFSGIAQRHGLTTTQLQAANPQISNINIISAGQRINIPARITTVNNTSSTNNATQSTSNTIKVGDVVRFTNPNTAVNYFGTNVVVPMWVRNTRWIVSGTNTNGRIVLGMSQDGRNNINSPVDSRFLTRV